MAYVSRPEETHEASIVVINILIPYRFGERLGVSLCDVYFSVNLSSEFRVKLFVLEL